MELRLSSEKDLTEFVEFEKLIAQKIYEITCNEEPAHDFLHFKRVVATARQICLEEAAAPQIVIPAAWLHDFVIIPKNDPRRKQASRISAEAALRFLDEIRYPSLYFDDIAHAIEAHSFSANIETRTLEARIVQDADRLDGLGAIGIARCFAIAGHLRRPFYSAIDPFCESRTPDDSQFTIDHFYAKLFKTVDKLKTPTGRKIGLKRVQVMQKYLKDLESEIG